MNKADLLKKELTDIIRNNNSKGWSAATSTNYSFKTENKSKLIYISKSGIDKAYFMPDDFMTITPDGNPTDEYKNLKSSAETLIHCALYDMFPDTLCILHSHSLPSTLLSNIYLPQSSIYFKGYEIQKGIKGIATHESEIMIPVFDNTQDIFQFSQMILQQKNRLQHYGFLMSKHGLYAWGNSIFEAKRHLETWEFLLLCELEQLKLKK